MMKTRSLYVLKKTGEKRWTIGYYKTNYKWVADSDWIDENKAAEKVRILNNHKSTQSG